LALESGLTLAVLFKHEFALAGKMKYNSAYADIQGGHFEDILYFISLEKTFAGKLKFGLTSAIPLKREFTFQGHEKQGRGFRECS
jgi:hypothetical protein